MMMSEAMTSITVTSGLLTFCVPLFMREEHLTPQYSSATRRTGRNEGHRDAPAGFAAAWLGIADFAGELLMSRWLCLVRNQRR